MALIYCTECGKQISDQAPACPGCGAPVSSPGAPQPSAPVAPVQVVLPKKKTSPAAWGCLAIIGIFIFALVASSIGGGSKGKAVPQPQGIVPAQVKPKEKKPLFVDLAASVTSSPTSIRIINEDSFDWTNVKFNLNSGVFRGGYVYRTARIGAGETFVAPAREFGKSDGTRFDPVATKKMSMTITCDTPKGNGLHAVNWK